MSRTARVGKFALTPLRGNWVYAIPVAMLAAGFTFTYKFSTELATQAEARQSEDFHERAQRATTSIVMRMKRYEAVLRGAAGLFSTGTEVTAARWDDYVATLDLRSWLPGVRSMSFVQAMGPGQVAYQQSLIRHEQPDFVIRPTPTRTAYVIRYSALDGVRTRAVLGIDLGADPARLDALQRAFRTGQVALTTSASILVQDGARRTAAIMFYPVPRASVPGSEFVNGAVGAVSLSLNLHTVLQGILFTPGDAHSIDVEVYEGDVAAPSRLIYASSEVRGSSSRFQHREVLTIGGTNWLVQSHATPTHLDWAPDASARYATIAGGLLSLLLSGLTAVVLRKLLLAFGRIEKLQRAHDLDAAQLTGIVTSAMDAIITMDSGGRIVLFNPAAESMFGWSREEMLARFIETLIPSRFRHALAIPFDPAQEKPFNEWRFAIRRDGTEFPIEASISRTQIERQSFYTLIVRDITERLRVENDLRLHRDHLQEMIEVRTHDLEVAKDSAEMANQAKSQFLANMSHELRTPMHAMLSYAELGRTRAEGEPKIEGYFSRIQLSGERLLTLINQLLKLSKLEAGRMVFSPTAQSVHAMAHEIVEELRALLDKRNQRVHLDLDLAADEVYVDHEQTLQVLRNLIANASKFAPEGTDIIIVSRPRASGVEVTVRDSGIGIPEAEIETIFDKFVQSSKTRSSAGGTGLGLAICKEIVSMQGGAIWAKNNPEGGASISFSLPVRPSSTECTPARALAA